VLGPASEPGLERAQAQSQALAQAQALVRAPVQERERVQGQERVPASGEELAGWLHAAWPA
jgi:hypothetical protein